MRECDPPSTAVVPPDAPPAARILLVDAHPAMRQGLALLLEAQGVGTCQLAEGRADALDWVRDARPDVAIVDLSADGDEGLALVTELHARQIPVIACSVHESPGQMKRALAAGAHGYITKSEAPAHVARAVRAVLEGWTMISPRATEALDEE